MCEKRPRRCVSSGEANRRAKWGVGAIRLWRNRGGGGSDMKNAPLWGHVLRSFRSHFRIHRADSCSYRCWKCEPGLAGLGFIKLAVGRQETIRADTPR